VCVNGASTGLCGGQRVTAVPTATEAGNGGYTPRGSLRLRPVLSYSETLGEPVLPRRFQGTRPRYTMWSHVIECDLSLEAAECDKRGS
jgi:hypothetical protein